MIAGTGDLRKLSFSFAGAKTFLPKSALRNAPAKLAMNFKIMLVNKDSRVAVDACFECGELPTLDGVYFCVITSTALEGKQNLQVGKIGSNTNDPWTPTQKMSCLNQKTTRISAAENLYFASLSLYHKLEVTYAFLHLWQ